MNNISHLLMWAAILGAAGYVVREIWLHQKERREMLHDFWLRDKEQRKL